MNCEYNAYRGIYFWPRSECISGHGQNYVSGGQNYVSGGFTMHARVSMRKGQNTLCAFHMMTLKTMLCVQ